MDSLESKMENHVSKHEYNKIWKHIDRFALYDDLKDLNSKFLPELAKIENRVFDFSNSLEKIEIMIRQFDENLSQKCSKLKVKEIFDKIDQTFVYKSEILNLSSNYEDLAKNQNNQISDFKCKIENIRS